MEGSKIVGPRHALPYDDAQIDCEEDLSADIIEIARAAIDAGWDFETFSAAIASLVEHFGRQLDEEGQSRSRLN